MKKVSEVSLFRQDPQALKIAERAVHWLLPGVGRRHEVTWHHVTVVKRVGSSSRPRLIECEWRMSGEMRIMLGDNLDDAFTIAATLRSCSPHTRDSEDRYWTPNGLDLDFVESPKNGNPGLTRFTAVPLGPTSGYPLAFETAEAFRKAMTSKPRL